jgi:2-enoate reductase
MHCSVNPVAGHEGEVLKEKTANPKNVLVIGGGVAGMQSALSCALAGHSVILMERDGELGGHALYASVPPHKENIALFVKCLAKRTADAGVDIRLNTEVTAENVDQLKADVIVLATGAASRIPKFLPGFDTMTNILTFEDVLTGEKPVNVGKRVLVLGGGEVGAEIADYLTEYGREVTIVEMTPAIISDAVVHVQHDLGLRLKKKNVQVLTDTKVSEFKNNSVQVELSDKQEKQLQGYDSVVLAMGLVSRTPQMMKILSGREEKIIMVGDSNRPRGLAEAMEEGFLSANQI